MRASSLLLDASVASVPSGSDAFAVSRSVGAEKSAQGLVSLSRVREVDGLRAVAVLAVMAFHFDLPLHGGFLGVDLFFAISGFVIGRGLLAQAASTEPTRALLRRFYARRAARLLPAALTALLGTLALVVVQGPSFAPFSRTLAHGLAAFGGTSNWFMVVFPDTPGEHIRPLLHTWSLGVEEQCYLALPLALLAARARARTLAYVIAGVGVVSSIVAGFLWPDPSTAFFLTPTRIAPVGLGVGLAALFAQLDQRHGDTWSYGVVRRWSGPLLLVLSVCLVPSLFFTAWTESWLYRGGFVVVGVVVTAIVAAAAIGGDGIVHRVLRHRTMQAIGARSYCLYLVHFPVAFLFASFALGPRTILRVVVSFALAEVVHRGVEYRFLPFATARSRWRLAPIAMAAASIAGFVLAAGV